jgi:hypothetical protein
MKQVMVQYKVKPGQTEKNEELVRAVYDELQSTEFAGLRYATFKLDDDVTFVHIAVETGDGQSSLTDLEAFKEFTKDIGERCDVAPVATGLREVGSFRFFGEDAARAN